MFAPSAPSLLLLFTNLGGGTAIIVSPPAIFEITLSINTQVVFELDINTVVDYDLDINQAGNFTLVR
jgi:hypothetical protein